MTDRVRHEAELLLEQTEADGSKAASTASPPGPRPVRWPSYSSATSRFLSRHVKNVFDEGELSSKGTVARSATVQREGDREVTRAHLSVQRNPIIAEVFYRTGLIEKWGRGTNRVAEMCKAAGIAPPEFAEINGAAVVMFRVPVAGSRGSRAREPESQPESEPESA